MLRLRWLSAEEAFRTSTRQFQRKTEASEALELENQALSEQRQQLLIEQGDTERNDDWIGDNDGTFDRAVEHSPYEC